MRASILGALLFASFISNVRPSPVTRDNDGSRPITWISPEGAQRCWQVNNGNIRANEVLVVTACDNSDAQRFIYNTAATSIQVANTNLCVEFGPGLGVNGRPLRVQTCRRNGAPGQRLFITDDNHIALQNGPGQCADVTNGGESAQLQNWRCAADNVNQIFFGTSPKAIANTIRPCSNATLCLQAYQTYSGDASAYFLPCATIEPAAKRFLVPSNNIVQHLFEPTGQLLTWAQVFVDYPGFTGYFEALVEDPPLEDVLLATPGTGAFEGLFRLGNAKSGMCSSYISFAYLGEDSGVFNFTMCDESDANQYYYFEPIEE